jgi:hypothetical protein
MTLESAAQLVSMASFSAPTSADSDQFREGGR